MTPTEIKALTDEQLEKAIADIGDHPFVERFQEEYWNRQAIKARDAFRKIKCVLPTDRSAHPMSGRAGEY